MLSIFMLPNASMNNICLSCDVDSKTVSNAFVRAFHVALCGRDSSFFGYEKRSESSRLRACPLCVLQNDHIAGREGDGSEGILVTTARIERGLDSRACGFTTCVYGPFVLSPYVGNDGQT